MCSSLTGTKCLTFAVAGLPDCTGPDGLHMLEAQDHLWNHEDQR